MKILYVLADGREFLNGCWWHRIYNPGQELQRRGHIVKSIILGLSRGNEWLDWADIVVFTRFYKEYPIKLVDYLKRKNKPIVYEIDDSPWNLSKDNVFNAKEAASKMADKFVKVADLVTTTVQPLADELKEHGAKNVAIIPNALNLDLYYPEKVRFPKKLKWRIGWAGGASHWADLQIILPVIRKLKKKYHNFDFVIQGLCNNPLEAEIYTYNVFLKAGINPSMAEYYRRAISCYKDIQLVNAIHYPWYPPELHPQLSRKIGIDIGLCPLRGTSFDAKKSCIKYYEYASLGAITIASDCQPYSDEVDYLAGDWYKRIEDILSGKINAEKLYQKQYQWVKENRDLKKVGDLWESNFKQLL